MRRFPENFRRMTYLEVFGGGTSVLFNKPRSAKEILNDYNSQLINLYRHVREQPEELKDRLRFVLNCREDFKLTYQRLRQNEYTDLLQKAADTYQVLHQSYGGHGKNFAGNPRGMWSTFPTITEACGRLQRVIIENWDFEKVFLTYDSLGTFSYVKDGTQLTASVFFPITKEAREKLYGQILKSYDMVMEREQNRQAEELLEGEGVTPDDDLPFDYGDPDDIPMPGDDQAPGM